MSRPIFLVGMPGAGKTTIGRKLSVALEVPFFDLDDFLEEKEGIPVREIFATRGEAYFRRAEATALREVTQQANSSIVATGGGAPCFYGNMDFMNQNGTTIYLKAPIDVLVERLTGHGREQRPLVAGKSTEQIKQFVTETLASRSEFYEAAQITYQNLSRGRDVSDLCLLISRMENIC
jgi:shikimate kinase